VAAAAAGDGALGQTRVLSATAVAAMSASPTAKLDAAIAGLTTSFTQGGVNLYEVAPNDSPFRRYSKELREGFLGWQGMGGSVCQWHPQLNIGKVFRLTVFLGFFPNSKFRIRQTKAILPFILYLIYL